MPRVQFSKEQRALISEVYFSTKPYVEVKRRFRITFPQSRVPCSYTIYRIKEKRSSNEQEHSTTLIKMALEDHERQEPGEILTPFARHWQEIPKSAREEILYQTYVSPISTGSQGKISKSTHIYKIQTRHALESGDPARRLRFCNWLLQMPQRTLAETCLVDESNFYMNGTLFRQDTRRYADRNNPPRIILCTTNQTTDANGLSLLHSSATTRSLAQSFLNAPSTDRFT